MTRILRLTVKAALALAAGCSLYLASHYSDGRRVPRWTTAVSPAGPIVERTSVLVRAVAPLEQRVRAANPAKFLVFLIKDKGAPALLPAE